MSRELVFSEKAELHLVDIQQYIAEQTSLEGASKYVGRILDNLDVVTVFPTIGSQRDDVRPGLRTFGFERRVIVAYFFDEHRVYVLGVYYGGREWESDLQ